jgi:HK97 family phage portal protein
MGFLDRIGAALGARPKPAAVPAVIEPQNVVFEESFWREIGLGVPSNSGEHVSHKTAFQVTTALRCALVISDSVSTIPCKLMHKDRTTGKRREVYGDEHPLADVLTVEANPWMDPLQLFETSALHTVFSGDSISFVNRVRGRAAEIIPLKPECVRVCQEENWRVRYWMTGLDGKEVELPREAVLHVRGPSWNGVNGMDPVKLAREALGLAMATERAHANRFRNGVNTSGVYSVTGTLQPKDYELLRAYIDQNMVGAQQSGKPFILDRDAKWTPMAMSGVDAQHVQTREFQIPEICRAFGVLPIMVGFADKTATYASAEQMFIAHVVHTARPWHRRYERAMKRQLLTRQDVYDGYYIKFFETELLRGAAKDRAEYYSKLFQMGALSPNDVRELEDQDGYEGGEGYWVPMNMQDPANPTPPAVPGPADPQATQAAATANALKERFAAGRVLSAENEALIRGARDNLDQILTKIDDPTQEGWQQP